MEDPLKGIVWSPAGIDLDSRHLSDKAVQKVHAFFDRYGRREETLMKATGKRSAVQSYEKLHREFLQATKETVTMGWTCPQCGVNYSPNVVRCPCTEKRNQEPPKDKSILDGMPVVTNKEFNFKAEHKTI